MNVRMPNGTMIKNVPAGTTKEELAFKLNNSSIWTGKKINVAFYGGNKSLGFSKEDSDQYDTMIQEGASNYDAYKKTNILVDRSGNKRHDMDVTKATYNNEIFKDHLLKGNVTERIETTVGEILSHPTLYKNYPFLKDMPFYIVNNKNRSYQGAYFPGSDVWKNTYGGDTEVSEETGPVRIEYNVAYESGDPLRTVIEEVQHMIDDYEDDRPYGSMEDDGELGMVATEANAESLQDQYDAFKNNKEKIPPYFVDGKVDAKKYEEQFVKFGGKNYRPFLGLYYVKKDKEQGLVNNYTNNYDDLVDKALRNISNQNSNMNFKEFAELLNTNYQLESMLGLTYDPETGIVSYIKEDEKNSEIQEEPFAKEFISDIYKKAKKLFNEDDNSFQNKMKQSESSGRYGIVNKEGFIGAYQFGDDRLTDYRKANKVNFTNEEFKSNKELQDKVFKWHVDDIISNVKKKKLDKYIGTKILGIEVTMDGITAMAHLGGKTGMQKFLETQGKYNPKDSGGTSLSDYLKKFGK